MAEGIVSPHPPLLITIAYDEQTGNTQCDISKRGQPVLIPVLQLCAIFSQLQTKYIKDAVEAQQRAGESAGHKASEQPGKTPNVRTNGA